MKRIVYTLIPITSLVGLIGIGRRDAGDKIVPPPGKTMPGTTKPTPSPEKEEILGRHRN